MTMEQKIIIDQVLSVVAEGSNQRKLFPRGTLWDYVGTITKSVGCKCNGTYRNVVHYIVPHEGLNYHVSSDFASKAEGIATEDTPDLIDRVENFGGETFVHPTSSSQFQEELEARRQRNKLIM